MGRNGNSLAPAGSPRSPPLRREARPTLIVLASLAAMVTIFLADVADGKDIWLHVLYLFPIGVLAFYCRGLAAAIIGLLLAFAFQLLTLFDYDLPMASVVANMFIGLAANLLTAGLARLARSRSIALEVLATTDALTGLLNRRGFEAIAEREIARQGRYGGTFSLALLDLNRFKQLNDTRGHEEGDRALRLLGDILRANLRQVDSAARIGGDEFVILMPQTEATDGAALCRKLSSLIVEQMAEAGLPLTASVGMVSCDRAPDSLAGLMQQADEAMYAEKARVRGASGAS